MRKQNDSWCRDCINQRRRDRYKAASPEELAKLKAASKAWYEANRDYAIAAQKSRFVANRDKINLKARTERYCRYRSDPEFRSQTLARSQITTARRRTKPTLSATVSVADWAEIQEYFDHACAYCGRSDVPMTMEHVTALSAGGEHVHENVVTACKPCNSTKSKRGVLVMLNRPFALSI